MQSINAIQWLVIKLHEKNITWPENVEYAVIAYEVEWRDSYENEIWQDTPWIERDSLLGFYEEYDDPEEVSKSEYFEFMEKNPNYVQEVMQRRQEVQGEIADRVKAIQQAVREVYALSDSAALPLSFSLGGYGVVDPAGDWQSSRC